jgi:cell fate (sporulation/competence/biofilm development) regulator YmcA (YheA/YmcA/DUF963 family)
MEKKSKDIFFVEVREPEEVRRNILESLKEIVESLQRFEKFKETRKDKLDKVNKLRKIVKDTSMSILDLKKSLPEAKIRAVRSVSKIAEKEKASGKKKPVARKKIFKEETKEKPMTELQKLESELNEIESKLESLR